MGRWTMTAESTGLCIVLELLPSVSNGDEWLGFVFLFLAAAGFPSTDFFWRFLAIAELERFPNLFFCDETIYPNGTVATTVCAALFSVVAFMQREKRT
jgi:hypothetical protein